MTLLNSAVLQFVRWTNTMIQTAHARSATGGAKVNLSALHARLITTFLPVRVAKQIIYEIRATQYFLAKNHVPYLRDTERQITSA